VLRYITDIRIGCGAILDTLHPEYKEKNGLHQDDIGIVYYIQGEKNVDENNSYSWEFSKDKEEFLKSMCAFLNMIYEIFMDVKLPLRMLEIGRNMNDFENDYSGLKQFIDNSYTGNHPEPKQDLDDGEVRFTSYIKRMREAFKNED
jgi:hypothetical protein